MTDLKDNVNDFAKDLENLNILVLGLTGVGKSSLINAIFGEETAKAGAGAPVTQFIEKYALEAEESIPISLYDSPGCEIDKGPAFLADIRNFLKKQRQSGIEGQIHIAWYVVSASGARFQDFEVKIIRSLQDENIPVIIVLSQCDRASRKEIDGVTEEINNYGFEKVYTILEISASPLEVFKIPPFGLDELVEKTSENLPKVLSEAFIAAQIANVKSKRIIAQGYVLAGAASCFAMGFLPFPFITAATAVGAQATLWNQIGALYKLNKIKGQSQILKDIVFSRDAIVSFAIASVADFFTATIVGALIAGGTAATFIFVVGISLTATYEEIAIKETKGISKRKIEQILQEIFRKNFNRYKGIKITKKSDLDKLTFDKLIDG